jgi:putative transposase
MPFWLRIMNELKNRGVEDVLIAVVDGLKGFPQAITAVFPRAKAQTCIVHLLRHSLDFVSWKDRKLVAAALKEIYRAVDADAGEAALTGFEEGKKYPPSARAGGGPGPRSFRSMPSPERCGGFCTLTTPRMLLRL